MINRSGFSGTLCLLILSVFLISCSTGNEKRVPAELKTIENPIALNVLWEERPNSGADGEYLFLRPFLGESDISVVDASGELVVLDRKSGRERFSIDLDESVTGGLGGDETSFYYVSLNGELVALDFDATLMDSDPDHVIQERYRVSLSSESMVPPVSKNGRVYVQTIDGKITAFNSVTGVQVWQYAADEPLLSVRGTALPVVTENMVITGFSNGELVGLASDSGLELWRVPVAEPKGRTELERLVDLDGSPASEEERLFVTALNGSLKMLEGQRGGEYWRKPVSSLSSPSIGYQSTFVADSDGRVIAFDKATGSRIWENNELSYRRLTGPVVLASALVTGDFEGYLHFLSQSDGKLLAHIRIDSGGIRSPLLVDGDVLYVFGNEGTLAAIKLGDK